MSGNKCENNDIATIANKVVMNNGQPNTNFARFLSPQYIIHDIQAVGLGNCVEPSTTIVIPTSSVIGNTNPIIVNKIPVLICTTVNYFVYKVNWIKFCQILLFIIYYYITNYLKIIKILIKLMAR